MCCLCKHVESTANPELVWGKRKRAGKLLIPITKLNPEGQVGDKGR